MRTSATLASKILGTLSNGMVVVGEEVDSERGGGFKGWLQQETPRNQPQPQEGALAPASFTALWVRVHRFEGPDGAVVNLRKELIRNGAFCLRRNALGFGLYEVGVEATEGPLQALPEILALELHEDAYELSLGATEDVSLTWKLLGAVDSISQFFWKLAGTTEEGGEITISHPRRKPEDMLESKQRERLRKAAGALRSALEKIVDRAGSGQHVELLSRLPPDVRRPLLRLRESLVTSAPRAVMLCRKSGIPASPWLAEKAPAVEIEVQPKSDLEQLEQLIQMCRTMERQGSWPEMDRALRAEVISFSQTHVAALEEFAKSLKDEVKHNFKETCGPRQPCKSLGDTDNLIGDLIDDPFASPVHKAPTDLPMLPPPPAPVGSILAV